MYCLKPVNDKSFLNCEEALNLLFRLPDKIDDINNSRDGDIRKVSKMLRKVYRSIKLL